MKTGVVRGNAVTRFAILIRLLPEGNAECQERPQSRHSCVLTEIQTRGLPNLHRNVYRLDQLPRCSVF
jgi:hypothetical protein